MLLGLPFWLCCSLGSLVLFSSGGSSLRLAGHAGRARRQCAGRGEKESKESCRVWGARKKARRRRCRGLRRARRPRARAPRSSRALPSKRGRPSKGKAKVQSFTFLVDPGQATRVFGRPDVCGVALGEIIELCPPQNPGPSEFPALSQLLTGSVTRR